MCSSKSYFSRAEPGLAVLGLRWRTDVVGGKRTEGTRDDCGSLTQSRSGKNRRWRSDVVYCDSDMRQSTKRTRAVGISGFIGVKVGDGHEAGEKYQQNTNQRPSTVQESAATGGHIGHRRAGPLVSVEFRSSRH